MGQRLVSQLDIKCCHEMFDDGSIDTDDEEETKKSKSLKEENTTNSQVTITKPPVKQNKNRSTSEENEQDFDDTTGSIYMNKKTMELLMKIDDTFSPSKRKESEVDTFPDTHEPVTIQSTTTANNNKELTETNQRLQQMQNLSNPADVELMLSTQYATDLESDSDRDEHLHLEDYSSIDEADQKEIAQRKQSDRQIEYLSKKSKSNVYRQQTTSIWSPEDMNELHAEMELQYEVLVRHYSDGRDVNNSNNNGNGKFNHEMGVSTSNLYRDESSEKWKKQEISVEKQQMRKEMLHLVQQNSNNRSKTKLNNM